MPEQITWAYLSSVPGATLLTFIIVAYTKKYVKLATDLYAVIVASVVSLLAAFGNGISPLNWQVYVLSIFGGFIIAAAAAQLNNKVLAEATRKMYTDGVQTPEETEGGIR